MWLKYNIKQTELIRAFNQGENYTNGFDVLNVSLKVEIILEAYLCLCLRSSFVTISLFVKYVPYYVYIHLLMT